LKIICESAEGLKARAGWENGEECARTLNPPARRTLPPDLAGFCRAQIKAWEKSGPVGRAVLEKENHELEHPDVPGRRAEVSLIRQRNFPLIEPFFLLRFKGRPAGRKAAAPPPISRGGFASLAPLSAREREVARLICEGHSNAGISRQLGKSVHTVKAQLHSIFEKLQVKSRAKLTALLMHGAARLLSVFSCDLLFGAVSL
jgi:DNA-binding CsgD family transcriptional regulator